MLYHTRVSPKELDRHYEAFRQANLPLNVWPFAREFFYNMTLRMGWPPFTLPLLRFVPESNSTKKVSTSQKLEKKTFS